MKSSPSIRSSASRVGGLHWPTACSWRAARATGQRPAAGSIARRMRRDSAMPTAPPPCTTAARPRRTAGNSACPARRHAARPAPPPRCQTRWGTACWLPTSRASVAPKRARGPAALRCPCANTLPCASRTCAWAPALAGKHARQGLLGVLGVPEDQRCLDRVGHGAPSTPDCCQCVYCAARTTGQQQQAGWPVCSRCACNWQQSWAGGARRRWSSGTPRTRPANPGAHACQREAGTQAQVQAVVETAQREREHVRAQIRTLTQLNRLASKQCLHLFGNINIGAGPFLWRRRRNMLEFPAVQRGHAAVTAIGRSQRHGAVAYHDPATNRTRVAHAARAKAYAVGQVWCRLRGWLPAALGSTPCVLAGRGSATNACASKNLHTG